MNKELFFTALKAVERIEGNLRSSDFVTACGKKSVDELMEYRLDLATDIYDVFCEAAHGAPSPKTTEASEQRNAWFQEYLNLT